MADFVDPDLDMTLAAITRRLENAYPQADAPSVVEAVLDARRGVGMFGLGDADGESPPLIEKIAERTLRLRLGLDTDDPRLDPESHRRPGG
jgi:hypothetical protein